MTWIVTISGYSDNIVCVDCAHPTDSFSREIAIADDRTVLDIGGAMVTVTYTSEDAWNIEHLNRYPDTLLRSRWWVCGEHPHTRDNSETVELSFDERPDVSVVE